MVSGGLDSYLAWEMLGYPGGVFVNYGQQYAKMEKRAISKLYGEFVTEVTINGLPELGGDIHVDARNLMLATIGLRFSDEIVFAGMEDEKCSDKNPKAFDDMSRILSSHSKNKEVRVSSPFWGTTKAEAVEQVLAKAEAIEPHAPGKKAKTIEYLKNTVSCYSDGDEPCNNCQACFRRWVALTSNGIEVPTPSDEIIKSYGMKRLHKMVPKRITATFKALRNAGYSVHIRTVKSLLESPVEDEKKTIVVVRTSDIAGARKALAGVDHHGYVSSSLFLE